ncbi:DUF4214 domain-containing protein [Methylobacterium nigriterrae]|uniref:DUF4214 domain-containing protein n=1 Tax=Methylobacterium nigriterrae TaxID=3127512 RepID=UPI0030136987
MSFTYTVTLNDPQQRSQDALLVSNVQAALNAWSQYIDGKGSVDVAVNVISLGAGVLAQCGPGTMAFAGTDGTRSVVQSGVVAELISGVDPNGSAPDITIDVNSAMLTSSFYLNPDPSLPSMVPAGRYDAITVLTHEIAHGFGIAGSRDSSTGALAATTESTWDQLVSVRPDGSAVFTGAHAQAVYGGTVPVTTVKNGEQYYHVGNSSADAASHDLLGGTGIPAGQSRAISPLDLAMLQDLGVPAVFRSAAPFGTIVHDAASPGGQVFTLYDALLGRAPDPLGLEGWTASLQSGATVRDLAQAFLASPEGQARAGALDNAAFVEQLYGATLHRHSDAAGLSYWTGQLAQGASRADVSLGFAFSPEHVVNIQSALNAGVFVPDANTANVARLYYAVLDRAPDAVGLSSWTNQVKQGASLDAVAQAFLTAPEVQAKTGSLTNAQYVDMIYENALGRHLEAAGLTYWTNQFEHGASRAAVALAIAESTEARMYHVSEIELGWHLA